MKRENPVLLRRLKGKRIEGKCRRNVRPSSSFAGSCIVLSAVVLNITYWTNVLWALETLSINHVQEANRGIIIEHWMNTTILRQERSHRKDAIVFLAQKRHSSYGRDSRNMLLKAFDLLHRNYLAYHNETVDAFVFHTGDFDLLDLKEFDRQLHQPGIVRLVDISKSKFWGRPSFLAQDDPQQWQSIDVFAEGYRHMIRFFAIQIWNFFREFPTKYDYILRLDEDSYIHSPITYNIFDFMRQNDYKYGFRMCSYEMSGMKWVWNFLNKKKYHPIREIDPNMCGMYNNFFLASVNFFNSPSVQDFLYQVDQSGMIHRKNLGDLNIHTIAVLAFCPQNKIHRFLDFTYEHRTTKKETRCTTWGGIQAGYNDENFRVTLDRFMSEQAHCEVERYALNLSDLSPSYQHVPPGCKNILLDTIVAGALERPGKQLLSG